MENEFKAIIEKNLPAQVGDVLKKRLEQAELDAIKVERQIKQLEEKIKTIDDLQDQIRAYMAFDERNSKLEAREKAVDEQERSLKIKTLEYQLESEKGKTEFTKSVALGLVRNTEYKRSLFDSKDSPAGVDQFGTVRYANATQNSNETNTAI